MVGNFCKGTPVASMQKASDTIFIRLCWDLVVICCIRRVACKAGTSRGFVLVGLEAVSVSQPKGQVLAHNLASGWEPWCTHRIRA